MISTPPTLTESPAASQPSGLHHGMQYALLRARPALLDGWEFSPEQIMAFFDEEDTLPDKYAPSLRCAEEDEVCETALQFED